MFFLIPSYGFVLSLAVSCLPEVKHDYLLEDSLSAFVSVCHHSQIYVYVILNAKKVYRYTNASEGECTPSPMIIFNAISSKF